MNMNVDLCGLRLQNPVLTASGTFGYGTEFEPYGDLKELGGIAIKGVSLEPRRGNPMPRIVETACGMLNAIGLQNVGIEQVLKKLEGLPEGLPVIANLYAQSEDDFARLSARFAENGKVAALEVNISCPNVRAGGMAFGQEPKMARQVTEAVKKAAGHLPVIVKLSPNVTDIRVLAKAAVDGGADALSLVNTLSGMAVDVKTRRPLLGNVIGGLSGPAIKPVALKMVYDVCQTVRVPVIGIGGITCARDVLEFILVGAYAVQVGTANIMRPDSAFRIAKDLPLVMRELGIESLDELRGKLIV